MVSGRATDAVQEDSTVLMNEKSLCDNNLAAEPLREDPLVLLPLEVCMQFY